MRKRQISAKNHCKAEKTTTSINGFESWKNAMKNALLKKNKCENEKTEKNN